MIDSKTARQRLDPKTVTQLALCWLLSFDALVRGHQQDGAITAFSNQLMRLAFLFGHEYKRLAQARGTAPAKLAQWAEYDACSRIAVKVWLTASERCDGKGLKHITFTGGELSMLKQSYEFLMPALPEVTLGAYLAAKQFVNRIVQEVV